MRLLKFLSNIPGWRTDRKIIVLESDDWGSIRMPSMKAYGKLKEKGLNLGIGPGSRMNLYDTLASQDDFTELFGVLDGFRDFKGVNPMFTAVSLTSNPDFERISAGFFSSYYHKPFTETLRDYNHEGALEMWKEGAERQLFMPEFHGREHLNVEMWMRRLRAGDEETLLAFEEGCWGFNKKLPYNLNYQAAFDVELPEDINLQKEIIESGVSIFKEIHGFDPAFFVPPNGPFNNELEEIAAASGIQYMSGSKIQKEPWGLGKYKTRFHFLGQKNKYNQRYITRNCFFEPNIPNKDWVFSCLKEIDVAFKLKKPAIISTHRVNYIGGHVEKNRRESLVKLKELLRGVTEKWPNVEFMTSKDLGSLMRRAE